MISHCVNGCPRPVGSVFRQREIWAEKPGGCDGSMSWVVSVVDTLAGTAVEARPVVGHTAIVATDLAHHSFCVPDVLVKARALLGDDGWMERTVSACSVEGCSNPVPMWLHVEKRPRHAWKECFPCSTRTVLACVECGAPDAAHTDGALRERLLSESTCFSCDLWRRRLVEGCDVVSTDWHVYGIGSGRGAKEHRGFGGAKWTVSFTDGRVVRTDDLWSGGEIPEWFRDRFVPTATVTSGWAKEVTA